MKLLAVLLVLVSSSAFAFTPDYDVRVTSDNTITLTIANDEAQAVNCSYSMSWFENILSFKRTTGSASIGAGDTVKIGVTKDIAAHVTLLKAKVECE